MYVHISVPISFKLLRLHHNVLPPTLQQTKKFTFMNVAYFEGGLGDVELEIAYFQSFWVPPAQNHLKTFMSKKWVP